MSTPHPRLAAPLASRSHRSYFLCRARACMCVRERPWALQWRRRSCCGRCGWSNVRRRRPRTRASPQRLFLYRFYSSLASRGRCGRNMSFTGRRDSPGAVSPGIRYKSAPAGPSHTKVCVRTWKPEGGSEWIQRPAQRRRRRLAQPTRSLGMSRRSPPYLRKTSPAVCAGLMPTPSADEGKGG